MSTIDAGAAKLGFVDAISKPSPEEKFGVFADLGIIEVPADYNHSTYLEQFRQRNRTAFRGYNHKIKDANFPNPSRVLKAGEKFSVKLFVRVGHGTTLADDHIDFLDKNGAVYTGAQGSGIVFEQKRDLLPKGRSCMSFDRPDRLFADDGCHKMTAIGVSFDEGYFFSLTSFTGVWLTGGAFLGFFEIPPQSA